MAYYEEHANVNIDRFPFIGLLREHVEDSGVISQDSAGTVTGPAVRERYLAIIRRVISGFRAHQHENGAIIDPLTGIEWHYSTPCYAFGGALLASQGETEHLESATGALLHAAARLAAGDAPQMHADFFTINLVWADRLLAPLVDPATAAAWRTHLRAIDPARIYQFQEGTRAPEHIHNWNAIAIAGEYLRAKDGRGGDLSWIERHLPYHVSRFTACGLYRDGAMTPGNLFHPVAYDGIARNVFATLIREGYDGPHAEHLRTHLVYGALTALFLQSPNGRMPGSGRSSHHIWNEATITANAEWAAGELADSAPELVPHLRRAGALAVGAIETRFRDDDTLAILDNRFAIEERVGYERYSIHTTYNLWTVSALATAYLFTTDAEESTVPGSIPAETGAYVLQPGDDMPLVVAANRGFFIHLEPWGDPATNPTGLVRIERAGAAVPIGPSEGSVASPRYGTLGRTGFLCHAPAWRDRFGDWHSLAGIAADPNCPMHGRVPLLPELSWRHDDETVELTLVWKGSLQAVRRMLARYRIEHDSLTVSYEAEGEITALAADIPLFAFDGEERSVFESSPDGSSVTVRFRGSSETITACTPGTSISLDDEQYCTRTGMLRRARIERPSVDSALQLAYRVELARMR